MVDTTNWDVYPFEVDGIQFKSLINPAGPIAKRLLSVSNQMFIAMNVGAIRDCVGDVLNMTRQEILNKLVEVNENASEAVIALAE